MQAGGLCPRVTCFTDFASSPAPHHHDLVDQLVLEQLGDQVLELEHEHPGEHGQ